MRRARTSTLLPLYVGGFLGPFGGGVLAVLIPQLRDAFDATTGAVAAAIPAYLVPFAVFQLVSGTVGERLGRRRVVRAGYVAYAMFSVAGALAPSLGLFLGARALQGAANAFLTPLVLAGLADASPPGRLGRSIGTFAAVQTAAIALSPLCGGLLGEIDWRLVFWLMAAWRSCSPPTRRPIPSARSTREPARLRVRPDPARGRPQRRVASRATPASPASASWSPSAATTRSASAPAGAACCWPGSASPGCSRGRPAGRLVDRLGRVEVALLGAGACAVIVALMGEATSVAALSALWFAVGAASSLLWAAINTMTVEAVPANRAGATSVVSAFKFAGNAAAPAMWLPLYALDVRSGVPGRGRDGRRHRRPDPAPAGLSATGGGDARGGRGRRR